MDLKPGKTIMDLRHGKTMWFCGTCFKQLPYNGTVCSFCKPQDSVEKSIDEAEVKNKWGKVV